MNIKLCFLNKSLEIFEMVLYQFSLASKTCPICIYSKLKGTKCLDTSLDYRCFVLLPKFCYVSVVGVMNA